MSHVKKHNVSASADVTYAFVNSETGNILGYLSVADTLDDQSLTCKLNDERVKLAVSNAIYIETIFWQKIDNAYQQAGWHTV